MPENPWRQKIAAHVPVVLDGVSHMIENVDETWATLRTTDGQLVQMPVRRLAREIARNDAPLPLSEKLETLELRASPAQAAKVEERKEIVRWFTTGLRPEQRGDEEPDKRHDPNLVPGRAARIRAMAVVLAKRRGTKVESAQKLIRTLLEKVSTGETGLYDTRMTADGEATLPIQIQGPVKAFLLDAEYQSTITNLTAYIGYCSWVRLEGTEIEPSERTFQRALELVYKRYPHLRLKSKSKASAADGPKVAVQRRQPERIGEIWMVDSTPSNVMVRDPYSPAGRSREYRLDHTKALEACSRYIVGTSVSEDVNGYAAGLCLADAFRRMTDEHDSIILDGRTHPRPFVGLPRVISTYPVWPRRLIMDNGREFLNKYGMLTLHRLGIDVEPMRVRDGRGKGRQERHFGTHKTGYEQHQLNYLGASVDERGRDATKDVILTWRELVDRDRQWTDLYNVTEHKGLRADTGRRISPTQRWIELSEEFGVTEMPAWRNVGIRFLPNKVYKLSRYGITRREFVYNHPVIRTLIEADSAAPNGTVRIFWDPVDLRQVYCLDPAGNAYEIPWVHRTEDTVAFGDFDLDWANGRLEGGTYSKKQARSLMIDMVTQWHSEDKVLLANRHGKKNAEEILASQLAAIQAGDVDTIIKSEEFVGSQFVESVLEAAEALELDDAGLELLPNVDAVDHDLFDRFG